MSSGGPLDEMVDGRGGVRTHWRGLLAAFSALGEGGLGERAKRLALISEEEGGTSLMPGAEQTAWQCDPVPLPLPAQEFAWLREGLVQRAELLQAILADLYGAQTLLADGKLPPSLVYTNPGFLRARREQVLDGPVESVAQVHCYAADLARGPDGTWRVLADLVADPGGIGYVRENRRLLGRVLPEAFRLIQVNQLRPFFDLWQDSLQRMAPQGTSNPVVGVLTPGTAHPDWFEHMLLARELSCALVEGNDLTLRNGRVYLKTLRGLAPIDILLSRVPGEMIDSLELSSGSGQGVPGAMDALRRGAVRIVNDPGAAVLEAPGLPAFLPQLAQHFLGENLKLPSVPTLWLGDAAARDQVLADPLRWALRPAADGAWAERDAVAGIVDEDDVRRRILASPTTFAAAGRVALSLAPSATIDGLTARPIVLRMYLMFDGQQWQTMPGGLARVLGEGGPSKSGLAGVRGGGPRRVKDVWVLNEEHRDIVGPAALRQRPLAIRRTTGDLPGRVAENFFWLGRYLERLEGAARLARTALQRLGRDTPLARDLGTLQILATCLANADLVGPDVSLTAGPIVLTEALLASVGERGPMGGLVGNVTRLTEALRDRLSIDMYAAFVHTLREVMESLRRVDGTPGRRSLDQLAHSLVGIIRFTATVSGLAAENMVQGGGRLFLDLGRRIERAQAVATDIATILERPDGREQSSMEDRLRLILELCDSAITYRNRYLMVLQPAPVLDLVIADDGNPRGLVFQLLGVSALLGSVVGETEDTLVAASDAMQMEAVALTDRIVAAGDQAAATAALVKPLSAIATGVATLSDAITRRYFALLPMTQSLGTEETMRGAA